MHWPRRPRKAQCGDYNEKPNESITHQLYLQNTLLTQVFNDFNHLSDEYGGFILLMGCFFPSEKPFIHRTRKPNRLISSWLILVIYHAFHFSIQPFAPLRTERWETSYPIADNYEVDSLDDLLFLRAVTTRSGRMVRVVHREWFRYVISDKQPLLSL